MGKISIASSSGIALVPEIYDQAIGTIFWSLVKFDNNITLHKRNDQNNDINWYKTDLLTDHASAPASLIAVINKSRHDQTYIIKGELTVCSALVLEGNVLTEFPNMIRGDIVSRDATGPAAFIQSTFGGQFGPGNFEALVVEGNCVVHYWKDNQLGFNSWSRGVVVSERASGPACLIQSDFEKSNLEALIMEGNQLVHYWRTSVPDFRWHRGAVVCDGVTGPATMLQSEFRADKKHHGNFEVLVLQGNNIVHYWRDNSATNKPWKRGVIVSQNATGPASMMEGYHGKDKHHAGNFEVLIPEGDNLIGYWRDNHRYNLPWNRIGFAI